MNATSVAIPRDTEHHTVSVSFMGGAVFELWFPPTLIGRIGQGFALLALRLSLGARFLTAGERSRAKDARLR